jgi:hypothetical protein
MRLGRWVLAAGLRALAIVVAIPAVLLLSVGAVLGLYAFGFYLTARAVASCSPSGGTGRPLTNWAYALSGLLRRCRDAAISRHVPPDNTHGAPRRDAQDRGQGGTEQPATQGTCSSPTPDTTRRAAYLRDAHTRRN